MADEEMFSNESEALYYRLRAIRDELERTEDPDDAEVLDEMLATTMDGIEMKATAEYREKAQEIVVRKDDPSVASVILHEKLLVAESIGGGALLAGGIAAAAVVLFGSGSFKFSILAIVFIVVGIMAFVACTLAKKVGLSKIREAYEALEGKTIIGYRLKKRDFGTNDESALVKEIVGGGKKKMIITLGVILAILVVLGLGAYLVYYKIVEPKQKYESAEEAFLAKDYSGALSLYNELDDDYKDTADKKAALVKINKQIPEYEAAIEAVSYFGSGYADIQADLTREKNEYYYNKAKEAYIAKDYATAKELYSQAVGYEDADDMVLKTDGLIHYTAAEKLAGTSLRSAIVELNQIKKDVLDSANIKKEFMMYEEFTGTYSGGGRSLNITDFYKKSGQIYMIESTLGNVSVSKSDRDDYYFMVEADGEWYFGENVLFHGIETYEERGREKTREVEVVLNRN